MEQLLEASREQTAQLQQQLNDMVSQKQVAAVAEAARQEAARKDAIMEAHLQGTANKATSVEARMDQVEKMMVQLMEQVGGIATQLASPARTETDERMYFNSPEPERRGASRSRSR